MHSLKSPRFVLVVAIPCWMSGAACRSEKPSPQPAPSAAVSNVDRLDPGEIAEGTELAYGLKIPREMRIIHTGPDEIQALGQIPPERVANYVRKHVVVDGVELGAARTVFDRAKVVGDFTGRLVRVEVLVDERGTKLVVRNLAPTKVVDPELKQEDRLKKYGLDPNGNLLDPTQL